MIATYPEGRPLLPEERLWKAVLWRAFDDTMYTGKERTLIVAKDKAIKWFKARAQDFIDVCYFSDYRPAYITQHYNKIYSLGKIKYETHQTQYLRQREKYLNDRRRQQGLQSSNSGS